MRLDFSHLVVNFVSDIKFNSLFTLFAIRFNLIKMLSLKYTAALLNLSSLT